MKKLIKAILNSLFKNRLYYINGPETLPPPLEKQQEEEAIRLLETDFEKGRELLITHNLRLVVYIAKKFEGNHSSVEDLISIGTIGLIKAVNTYKPEKAIKLATYASRCIENEILMFLRKANLYKNEISIDEPLNVDFYGNELYLSDMLGTETETVNARIEQQTERKILNDAVKRLNSREQHIMTLRFGLSGQREHTQKEVADMIGISQSYISRLEKRIIKRLKNELEKLI